MAICLAVATARAEVIVAEPITPIDISAPDGATATDVEITLQVVVDAAGNVESVAEMSRSPSNISDNYLEAAIRAVKAARFHPSTKDGQPIRSRIKQVVVFHAPSTDNREPADFTSLRVKTLPGETSKSDTDSSPPNALSVPSAPKSGETPDVSVHGTGWYSPRGLGDFRIDRQLLTAAPRQHTSEMLSAAPGFFVDHEDGEGLGNDVYLRGFDLNHGSGIEMRLGSVPINIPMHIQGQGYTDANFIIPEVVRSIRVLEGPFDARQGDAAIVGSAFFDLGVPERGYQLKTSYGSFNQTRIVGIAAPEGARDETFTAFALRRTDGFGQNRESESGSLNSQYAIDLSAHDQLRLVTTAYAARASLAGVLRNDDITSGRIGYFDSYPNFAQGQGIQSSRVILAAEFEHMSRQGAHLSVTPYVMWTNFRSRQNFTGDLESSQIDPRLFGIGDLFETTNAETAWGFVSAYRTVVFRIRNLVEIVAEPGVYTRLSHTEQTKSLLDPSTLQAWDRRIDSGIDAIDTAGYVDLDMRIRKRLRVSVGPRADLLWVSINDRLANVTPVGTTAPASLPASNRGAIGIAPGLHLTGEYAFLPEFAPVVSFGQGFRSLPAERLQEGTTKPYSTVRSLEAGVRASLFTGRLNARLAAFETWVDNELVFEAESGGLETQNRSTRRGFVASFVAKPARWLLVSSALSAARAVYDTRVPGVSHIVPNVPSILFRSDMTARGRVATFEDKPMTARVGVGYTILGGRHLTDTQTSPTDVILNANAGLSYDWFEVGIDSYNVLGLKYADDAQVYVSNWSLQPGQHLASSSTHISAAPPRTVLGTFAVHF